MEEVQPIIEVAPEPAIAVPELPQVPAEVAQELPAEVVTQEETVEPVVGPACESCGVTAQLFDVPHHQIGNPKVWHYCARCKAVHEKELVVLTELKEIAQTHPTQADTPKVAGMLHEGKTVEEIKAELDRTRQPDLEAEIVE